MADDEELLRAMAGGDCSGLAELAARYERALLDLSLAILGSHDLACDVVQEVWLRVIRYAGGFQGCSSAKTWLYRIAINQCRTAMAARPTESLAVIELHATDGEDPAHRAALSDECERLKRLVESLSVPLRETVLLCYTHGLTHKEAAEAMGVPLGTVKSRLSAALEQLRQGMAMTNERKDVDHDAGEQRSA
jgi:RNA polymerase sigma-70 factor (ECF subfamily)